MPCPAARQADAAAETASQVRHRLPEGGHEAGEQARQQRYEHGEGAGRGVHANLVNAREVGRQDGAQYGNGGGGERHANDAAENAQQQILRQHRADQAPASAAERVADGEFRPAGNHAGHAEIPRC